MTNKDVWVTVYTKCIDCPLTVQQLEEGVTFVKYDEPLPPPPPPQIYSIGGLT